MRTIKILFIIGTVTLISGAIMLVLYLLDIINNTDLNRDINMSLFGISVITTGLSMILRYYNSIIDKINS
jgi:hypothetical protein